VHLYKGDRLYICTGGEIVYLYRGTDSTSVHGDTSTYVKRGQTVHLYKGDRQYICRGGQTLHL